MSKRIITQLLTISLSAACTLTVLSLPAPAEEEALFLSLTRVAEPLEDMPTNVSVVSREEIRDSSARNAGELLEQQVGLGRGRTGTLGALSTLSLRGSTAEQVLVMVDGRRINSIANGTANVSDIPVDNIERIEIIRGAASAIYGANAFGGVVNIITREASSDAPVTDLAVSGSSFDSSAYRLNFGISNDAVSSAVTASKNITGGWRENSDYDGQNFFTRVGYDMQDAGYLDFSGSLFRSNQGAPGPNYRDEFDIFGFQTGRTYLTETQASMPAAFQNDRKQYARLEYNREWEVNYLRTSVHASNHNVNAMDDWGHNDSDAFTFGGDVQFETSRNITVGAEWCEEQYEQTNVQTGLREMDNSRVNSAGYIQQRIELGRFVCLPSLRYDMSSVFGGEFSPRMTAIFNAGERVKLSLNTGRAWRAPTFNDLYYPYSGNPDLKPEEGYSSDAGVEYRKGAFRTAATAFYTETRNLIQWGPTVGGLWTPQNIGKSRQTGFEFELDQRLVGRLFHRINYTYLHAVNADTGSRLIYRPHNRINYGVTYLAPWGTDLGLSAQYAGSQDTGDFLVPVLAEYTTVDFRASQKISSIDVWLEIRNIGDTRYQTRFGYPLPGMTVAAGMSLRLLN